ncbi:hypothetical protein DPMN_064452 [Dreissena polymorpha]|uniref:Uncharacterized protein n=1 Tax=Dreissena polymorpha TaxID=45954 RepID=A0A9D4CC93_DREPO|nr:hypothetical protein DPMN_064452 [Dreissena polymorpha]
MENSTNNTRGDINMKGEKLEKEISVKNLGATLAKDGINSAEVRLRIAMATPALARLSRLWKSSTISFPKQAHALQVTRSFHPTVLLRDLDTRYGSLNTSVYEDCTASPTKSLITTNTSGTWQQHLLTHESPFFRLSNDESWLALDT